MQERVMGDSGDRSVSVVAFTSCLSRRRRRKSNGRRCPAAAACLSPSCFFARWRKSKDEKKKKKRAPAAKVLNGESPLPLRLLDSGGQKEHSFNQGIGLGLMYVIAGCRNELNRIVDLRLQFETLIQRYKAETDEANGGRQQQQLSTPSSSDVSTTLNNVSACFNTDSHETFKDNNGGCSSSSSEITTTTTCSCDGRRTKCNKNVTGGRRNNLGSSEMDELVAELEAELGRLQLDLDSDVAFKHPAQQDNEIIIVEENEGSHNARGEDVVNIETTYEEYEHGVSPYELEIRLHEVLEERQQERIEELESALESAMEKLHRKDEELSWWKDTAKLISQHVSTNVPRFLRRSATTK